MMRNPRASVPLADPNVDEIRAIRAKLSARFDNDIDKLCEYLRQKEAEYGGRVVQPGKIPRKKDRRAASF
jgi:hypothetical protein